MENGRLYVGSADGRVYALEAATGRLLWSYRVAPQARWIPVYGRLISTWPVAGGVVVQDGVVYAAAGIAHYDGTYVVALDAVSGKAIWNNDTSGVLSTDVNCGISLQGELQVRGDELQFLGGGAYQMARFDRKTGACLNSPRHQVNSQWATAFYPYFPFYAKHSALNHTFPDGRTLRHFAMYDASRTVPLSFLAAPEQNPAPKQPARGGNAQQQNQQARAPQRATIWQDDGNQFYTAFVVTPEVLITGGPSSARGEVAQLSAISLNDGSVLWHEPLESVPVKAGIAIDSHQRIVVTLENGKLVCFTPGE